MPQPLPPSRYYPRLSEIISVEALPDFLSFVKDGIKTVFDHVYYKNLQFSKSARGDAAFYRIDIVSKTAIEIQLPFGLALVLNPDEDGNTAISSFPISVAYQWEILAFIKSFNFEAFSFSPLGFFNIALKIFNLTEEQIIAHTLNYFTNPVDAATSKIQTLLTQINTKYSLNITLPSAEPESVAGLVTAIKQANLRDSVSYAIFLINIIDTTSAENTKNNIQRFFQSMIPENFEAYILKLITPKIKATLEISVGVKFPANILQPVTADGTKIPDAVSMFTFAKAVFSADTEAGIGYNTELGGSLKTFLTLSHAHPLTPGYASIGDTGLIIQIDSLKIDLSKKVNIAEADLDGRPEDFIGVYARAVSVALPSKWFHEEENQSTNTLRIGAYNLLIGTGGFSGTILLETIPVINAGQITDYYSENFTFNYPVTVFKKNAANNSMDEVAIGNYTALLAVLNANLQSGNISAFKFPLSLTTITNNEIKDFDDIAGYQKYLSTLSDDHILWKKFGENGFKIGFSKFDITFKCNKVISSNIEGHIVIPNFKDALGNDVNIDVQGHLFDNGDFNLTASVEAGVELCLGAGGSVFKLIVYSMAAGRDHDKVYFEVTGKLDFSSNRLLSQYLKSPIEVKKLRIYSDGSFEIEGGSIPIPGTIHLNLGPVEVSVTNITLGAEKLDPDPNDPQDKGNYKFIGFDCGVSTGAGGLDLRGDGIKIYFNHNGSNMFLRIAGIGINLTIPGNAKEEDVALILKGYLSLKKDEYTGSIAFSLPKVKIAGGAAMKMKPKIPAFAIDSFLELSVPIPLGPTGLGIYGFRGLFGLRYIADLPENATSDPNKMFDFYKEEKFNPLSNSDQKGLHIGKIVTPDERKDESFKESGTPISIGAGISLCTSSDAGRAFSMQAFLFLSIPEVFIISGKANVLSERVSLADRNEPPFFAYVAFTKDFISMGMGAKYSVPNDPAKPENIGDILDLEVDGRLAFFFRDASAWYVHFGTKESPNQAKVLKKVFDLNVYAYLVLSASGIETGAGLKFLFDKTYGPVKVTAKAYAEMYAMISFRKPQVGGGIACGGSIDVSVWGFGFNFSLDAYLTLTAPKPFIIRGGIKVCVGVDLWLIKFNKCVTLEFKWEVDQSADLSEILIIDTIPNPASAIHKVSGNTYSLDYFKDRFPDATQITKTIPLDTYIDIMLKKPVDPVHTVGKLSGATSPPPANYIERVPPGDSIIHVTHQFEIIDITIKALKENGSRIDYNPYNALGDTACFEDPRTQTNLIGSWQKSGLEYNKIRLLDVNPLGYVQHIAGKVIPEQWGVTSASLFCAANEKEPHCITWDITSVYRPVEWNSYGDILLRVYNGEPEFVLMQNVFNIPAALKIANGATLEILLPEKVLNLSLKLFSYSQQVKISYYDLVDFQVTINNVLVTKQAYTLIKEVTLTYLDFLLPVVYEDAAKTIKRVVIEPVKPDENQIFALQNRLHMLNVELIKLKDGDGQLIAEEIATINDSLIILQSAACNSSTKNEEDQYQRDQLEGLNTEEDNLKSTSQDTEKQISELCGENIPDQKMREKFIALLDYGKITPELLDILASNIFTDKDQPLINELLAITDMGSDEFGSKRDALLKRYDRHIAELEKKCEELTKKLDGIISGIAKIEQLKRQLEEWKKIILANNDDNTEPAGQNSTIIRKCSTYTFQLCYQTQKEVIYNLSIPSQAAVDGDYEDMGNTINKKIQPIWRPDGTYAIEVITDEIINGASHPHSHYFAFKTEGPIGHFSLKNLSKEAKEQFQVDDNGHPLPPVVLGLDDGNIIPDPDHQNPPDTNIDPRIEIPENSLKFYIDYTKSYPNPIGNIINQKPLYYGGAQTLLLYFTDYSTYLFFTDWPAYQGLGARYSSMVVEIKDPVENSVSPTSTVPSPHTAYPSSNVQWDFDSKTMITPGIDLLNKMRFPLTANPDFSGITCWQTGGDPIKPVSKFATITITDLKPLKLYNAVISNKYSNDGTEYVSKQIHSYPFQTSRYRDLDEQINSYHLKEYDFNTKAILHTQDAIFDIVINLSALTTSAAQLTDIIKSVDVTNSLKPELIQAYPDIYRRIVSGYLQLEPLHPAISTEFNLIKDENGNTIALMIRNPEPFNDPRIPLTDLKNSIDLFIDEQSVVLTDLAFSKDSTEIILFHSGFGQPMSSLKVQFKYLEWNGSTYISTHTPVKTDNLLI